MAKDKSEALQGLAKSLEDLSGIGELAEEIKDLKDVIVDSNEELIATFVEGTKRIIKKEDKDVSPQLKNLSESITGGLEAVKKGIAEVERGVKSIKLPSGTDFRATGAMLKLPIKELTRAVEGLDLNMSTDAKKPIAVRLSDGENFYKALDQVIQTISGGGSSSYAFDTQGGSPTKAATVQVSVGGKTRDAIVVVNPDGTEVGGSAAGGGLTDAELRATPVPVSLTSTTITGTVAVTQSGTWDEVGINDSGNSITVDQPTGTNLHTVVDSGTITAVTSITNPVAVTQSGTWDEVGINDSGNVITVDGSGSAGTAASGVVTVQGIASMTPVQVSQATASNLNMTEASAANILTSVQLIDDAIFVDDTATHTPASTKLLGIGGVATPTDTSVNANDIGMFAMSLDRRIYADANIQQGDADVAAGNPLQVTLANTGANATAIKINIASGGIASGAIASGAVASGAIASGAVASGAFASGSIAVGAIAAGDTSIATTEDTARAAGEHLVKVGLSRLDTPVANAGVSNDGDYTNFIADNFGKTWVTGTVPEDTAHVAGEALTVTGARRIDTLANSAGSSADWGTVNQTAEGALWATLSPTTTSGLSTFMASGSDGSSILVATAQAVKASAGLLYGYYLYNPESSATFVHFYNTAAASVTVGTTNPLMTVVIPATSAANLTMPYGITFSNAGWSIAATTTAGGNTAPSTGVSAVIWYL